LRSPLLSAGLLAVLLPVRAAAQGAAAQDDPAERAPVRLGPLALAPTFQLSQIGTDTNVLFSETNPRRDFTFTATPGAQAWFRVGDLRLASRTSVDWVYYARTPTQRSVNLSQTFTIDAPLASIRPRLSGEYINTRQRPNAELDARVRRRTSGLSAGALVRIGPLTGIDVEAGALDYTFEAATVDGVRLDEALNRRTAHVAVALQNDITPLTTLAVRLERQRSTFVTASGRDAAAWSLTPGLEFQPLALLSGHAYAGYQSFTPEDARVAPFRGLVARVDLRYLMRETTRLRVRADRQVEFSYWPGESYYVSTALELEARQAVAADWDVVARAGRERLAYQRLDDAPGGAARGRRDRIVVIGGGVGYWFGFNARLGVDLLYSDRQSDVAGRSYSGLRFGGSFGYGF
jgi:hypothetical protein